jgi:hypothetical protein
MHTDRRSRDLISLPSDTSSSASRREFLHQGAAAFVLAPLFASPALARLIRMRLGGAGASAGVAALTLKPLAQYQSEAAQFESAMQRYASASALPIATSSQRKKVTDDVATTITNFNLYYSALVATAAADSALVAWVKKEIRDEATFKKFVDGVMKDPAIVNSITGIDQLRARLANQQKAKRDIIQKLLAKELAMVSVEQSAARLSAIAAAVAAAGRSAAATCQPTWVVVTAVVVVVVAVVIAATSIGAGPAITAGTVAVVGALTAASVAAAAAAIAARYAGTGAAKMEADLKAATDAYNRCITAAVTLPPSQVEQAVADCQAQLLAAQMAAIA